MLSPKFILIGSSYSQQYYKTKHPYFLLMNYEFVRIHNISHYHIIKKEYKKIELKCNIIDVISHLNTIKKGIVKHKAFVKSSRNVYFKTHIQNRWSRLPNINKFDGNLQYFKGVRPSHTKKRGCNPLLDRLERQNHSLTNTGNFGYGKVIKMNSTLLIMKEDVTKLSGKAMPNFVIAILGLYFQFHRYYPSFTALRKCMYPCLFRNKKEKAEARARRTFGFLGPLRTDITT